jgi:hypothetical protein
LQACVKALKVALEARRPAMGSCLRAGAAIGSVLAGLLPDPARCHMPPADVSVIRNAIGSRVEAMTILGGDFALAGGNYKFTGRSDTEMDISKLGGAGDAGEPQKLGDLDVAWQPWRRAAWVTLMRRATFVRARCKVAPIGSELSRSGSVPAPVSG